MPLIKRPFADTFTFGRPVAATARDATGALVEVAADVPRFDHAEDGTPRGLLVEAGARAGQQDALQTVGGWAAGVDSGTVMHEFESDGRIVREAWYVSDPKAGADACLRAAVHHREIIVVVGHLRNRGGYVRYNGRNWVLGDAVALGTLTGAVLGDADNRPLISG